MERREVGGHGAAAAASPGADFPEQDAGVAHPSVGAFARPAGLPEPDAYELLVSAVGRPIEAGVAHRIIAGTGGKPLAIVEAAAD
ncbi:hypothetical protein [Modestobacter marinus]|uniref:hypothetical protein n=1 Tax=Modestobacter marinus TaxID=477641 RepID=UPI001C97BC09|nr:hypothetical protein [Modestobacter marinus]